jgi:hypothetical protein
MLSPIRTFPTTLTLEPKRPKLRTDNEEPRAENDNTEKEDPKRE